MVLGEIEEIRFLDVSTFETRNKHADWRIVIRGDCQGMSRGLKWFPRLSASSEMGSE